MRRLIAFILGLIIGSGALQGCSQVSNITEDQGTTYDPVTLVRVVDGDTLVVNEHGIEQTVRLIGIDAPESVHPDTSRNSQEGEDASKHLSTFLSEGQMLYLESDVRDTDDYGRLLRYVWLEIPEDSVTQASEYMLNYQLVHDGFAVARNYPPDTKYADLLHSAKG